MIDRDTFSAGMALLAGAFGREVDTPVIRAYYGVLSSKLTTEEYERAVSLALAQETYWPSPAVLLGKVKADPGSHAAAALEHVNRVLGEHGGHRFLGHATFHESFDGPTKAAISAVGGLAEICNTSIERYGALQRKFAAAYTEAAHPKALPVSRMDLAAGVRSDG